MGALAISLMITGPIILIGTTLYLWKQRATSSRQRRCRGFQILVGLMLLCAALHLWMWAQGVPGIEQRELRGLIFQWALCLAYPLFQLWKLRRGHNDA